MSQLYEAQDLPIAVSRQRGASSVPVYSRGRQVGRATSGTSEPDAQAAHRAGLCRRRPYEALGSRVDLEWTVEGRRGRAAATVVPLPFFDPPRKRA